MTAAVKEAVIQFTEAKIELYEIIEVMSVLSREHLTGEVEMRDVATLMELMTKTISSARCVVEFLKVMSTPLPTFGLPSKQQQDENENPLLPAAGLSSFAETPSSSNCSAAASSPSLPSSSQPGASTASPTSVCSSRTSRDAFVTPGNSPEMVISGHLRQLGRSLDCTSVASPREDDDEQEDLSMLQAQAAENWTAWRSEGYKTGLDKLKERFAKTDSRILEVSDDDNSRIEEDTETPSRKCRVVDNLADSFQEVREKFGNLSGSRIEDLSASELEELLGELGKVEKESLENVKKELSVRRRLSVKEMNQEQVEAIEETSLKLDKSLTIGEDQVVSRLENLDRGPMAEPLSYEEALNSLRLKFKDLNENKVEELDQDQAEELVEDLRLLHVQMIEEKKSQHFCEHKEETRKQGEKEARGVKDWKFDLKEEVEEVKPSTVKVEPHEAVNSTLAPQSMPPPPPPSELSPIRAKPIVNSRRVKEASPSSCLRGSRGFPLVQHSVRWKEEAKIHYFPRVQGWASVPKEGGATLGMEAKHCFEDTIGLREEGEGSGRNSPDITVATDQYANREMKKSTRSSSRLSMSMSSLSSSSSASSSAYSSASSSFFQPTSIEEEDSFCPPPPPPLSKTAKSIKKATRSSVRLSVAPCLQDEWRSLPTKPGILKLSRLPVTDTSPSLPSSDSSLSTSLNSSRGGKGELGTRGLVKVGSRARKQLLKQAGVEVDPVEGEELRQLRVSRSITNCGCDCEGHCGQQCPCVQGGIPCHEEEPGEPCGCNQSQCGNPSGRYRFDQTTVEMHFAEVKMGIVSLG